MEVDWKLYCRALADFALAQLRHGSDSTDPDLVRCAGDVRVYRVRALVSVRDLTERAAAHRWNAMIYEAWSWEFGNQIRRQAAPLYPLEREALMTYARSCGDIDIDYRDAYKAIVDAQRELGGADDEEEQFDEEYELPDGGDPGYDVEGDSSEPRE